MGENLVHSLSLFSAVGRDIRIQSCPFSQATFGDQLAKGWCRVSDDRVDLEFLTDAIQFFLVIDGHLIGPV